jgi:hypothetical protein
MIKLDQDGNVDKPKVQICVKRGLQKKKDPTIEDHPHSPAASTGMSNLPMADASRKKLDYSA